MITKRLIPAAIATFLTIGAATTHATSLLPINLAQTVEAAESAFTGTVQSVIPVQTPLGTTDEITVEISQPIFGAPSTSNTITWRQLNRVGRVVVAGMPTFTTGTKTMVFLAGPGPGTGLRSPIGFGHGAFRVFTDTRTGTDYARNEFMNTNLMCDLDTTAVATQIAQRRLLGKPPSPAAIAAEAKAVQRGLLQRQSGATSVQSLIEAAQLFNDLKKLGKRPTQQFALPTPRQ